jgi:hypothetical protein
VTTVACKQVLDSGQFKNDKSFGVSLSDCKNRLTKTGERSRTTNEGHILYTDVRQEFPREIREPEIPYERSAWQEDEEARLPAHSTLSSHLIEIFRL